MKTLMFNQPDQLAIVEQFKADVDRLHSIKDEMQTRLNIAMEEQQSLIKARLRSLEETTGLVPGTLDGYNLDTTYLDDHHIAFAFPDAPQQEGPHAAIQHILQRMGVIGGPDDSEDPAIEPTTKH